MIIIAEAGINHNGDVEIAKKLVDAAKDADADAIKFQRIYHIRNLQKYWLFDKDFRDLKEYCDKKNITFLCTPHTFESIHMLDDLVPMYKIASTYLGNINFLREVASKDKPILLSTGSLIHKDGMATLEEIEKALSYIPDANVTLLHCVSKYPCFNSHLERVEELEKLGYNVGISDHTRGLYYDRKYSVVEKHITLTHNMNTPDKLVSINPEQFGRMVKCLRSL